LSARSAAGAPLFLVGFMGVGKSTAGRALALRWGWDFEDTDDLVERTERCSIEEIFHRSGEGRFRDAEWDALRSLARRERVVVATGGGLFLGVAQRAFVRSHGVSCWLDAPLAIVALRVGGGASRPLWLGDDPLLRRAFFERRRAAYALADCRVDAGRGDADEVASAIETARRSIWR